MTQRLAFIDDETLVRESVAQLLSIRGYEVFAYESAEAFLEAYDTRESVDCIVVDQRLPEQSGCELIRHLRARGDLTPAVLLSGNIDEGLEEQVRSLPRVETLGKPCLSAQLYETIEKCICSEG